MKGTSETGRYFNTENWKNFVVEKIVPIWQHTVAFSNFWKFLSDFDGEHISETLRKHPALEIVFLGDTTPPFEHEEYVYEKRRGYMEGSRALIFKEVFGVSIDLNAYYSFTMQDLKPEVPIEVKETEVMLLIKRIKEMTSEIIRLSKDKGLLKEEPSAPSREYIHDPRKMLEDLLNFLQLCLDTSVGINLYVTFAWNIHKITKKYLNEMFFETKEPENMRFLFEVLGLEEYFAPEVREEDKKRDYTLYAYPDYATKYAIRGTKYGPYCLLVNEITDIAFYAQDSGGENIFREYKKLQSSYELTIGGCLCKLNDTIWTLFKREKRPLSSILTDVPNPEKEYLEKCDSELANKGWGLKYVRGVWDRFVIGTRQSCGDYEVSGPLITKGYGINIRTYQDIRHHTEELNRPFFLFLDNIMPAVYLGLYELVFSERKQRFVVFRRGD